MENSKIIEYKSCPISIGFYSPKYDKIFINPIAKKYPTYHEYLIKHELKHYYNNKLNYVSKFINNILIDWIDLFKLFINMKLLKESSECEAEFNNICFTEEEMEKVTAEFGVKTFSKEWFSTQLYINARPDGNVFLPMITYKLTRIYHTKIMSLVFSLLSLFLMYCIRNAPKLKITLHKYLQ